MENELVLAPITGWEIAPIAALDAITIQLQYSSNPLLADAPPLQTKRFVIHTAQAKELIAALERCIARAQAEGKPGEGLPKH